MSHVVEPTVPSDKQALRHVLRARRRSLLPQQDRGVDAAAIAASVSDLLDSVPFPPSPAREHPTDGDRPCVAIYRSLPYEPPTEALAEMLHARGIQLIVPETLPDLDLEWRELLADGSEGPRLGLAGIGAAQLILTPALAIDHHGIRLGQGGGCYDRALARRRSEAVIVAIVNDQEYAPEPLPHDEHDVPVDAVITPGRGLSRISGRGSVA